MISKILGVFALVILAISATFGQEHEAELDKERKINLYFGFGQRELMQNGYKNWV